MKCVICHDYVDTESPFLTGGVFGVNPLTFREAWMHGYCLQDSEAEIKNQPAKDVINFANRYDEYMQVVQERPTLLAPDKSGAGSAAPAFSEPESTTAQEGESTPPAFAR